ncbi:hypothetical protein CASFOL_032171 [Castilleja foliolosa]|uniref:C2H2-type domain-containing protein n=1 Tax=Castilleja foliolosa TaxID=1961234 RepID=A0ABD3C0P1_9LAMI
MVAQEDIVLIKGKRSKRPRPPSPLALNSSTTTSGGTGAGASSDELTRGKDEEAKDVANCLMLLAKGQTHKRQPAAAPAAVEVNYRCKTCNKNFSSFQALGGHSTSHTKPQITNKPTILMGNKQEFFLSSSESTILSLHTPSRISSPRVHECSICGVGFASGQALGGHMRRHRPLQAAVSHVESRDQAKRLRTVLSLDLNLPAPEDNNHEQQVIVFSAPSLVDCHF